MRKIKRADIQVRIPSALLRDVEDYRAKQRPIPPRGIVVRAALADYLRRQKEGA